MGRAGDQVNQRRPYCQPDQWHYGFEYDEYHGNAQQLRARQPNFSQDSECDSKVVKAQRQGKSQQSKHLPTFHYPAWPPRLRRVDFASRGGNTPFNGGSAWPVQRFGKTGYLDLSPHAGDDQPKRRRTWYHRVKVHEGLLRMCN
jgi:hypothetical protein